MLCSKCTKLLIDDGTETTEVPDYILLPNPKSIPKQIPNTLLNISHTFFISHNLSYAEQYPYISIKTLNMRSTAHTKRITSPKRVTTTKKWQNAI